MAIRGYIHSHTTILKDDLHNRNLGYHQGPTVMVDLPGNGHSLSGTGRTNQRLALDVRWNDMIKSARIFSTARSSFLNMGFPNHSPKMHKMIMWSKLNTRQFQMGHV